MKCPCEQCISFAICKGQKIIYLFTKCDILLDYIKDDIHAREAIKIIRPPYIYNIDIIMRRAEALKKFNNHLEEMENGESNHKRTRKW